MRPCYQNMKSKQLYLIHRNKQGGYQNEETKKHGPNERIPKLQKTNKMDISNLSDAEFKTLVIRMLKELSVDLSNIKKIQS